MYQSNKRAPGIDNISPLNILLRTIKEIPAARYFLGVVGLSAAATLVGSLFTYKWVTAIIACFVILLASVAVVIFSRVTKLSAKALAMPAMVITWLVAILILMTSVLMLSSFFFGLPLDMRPASFIKTNGPSETQNISTPILGSIIRIDHKDSFKGVDISLFPPALRLLIADTYLNVGSKQLVKSGDYFKILKSTKISDTSKFTDYIGIIKIKEVRADSSLGKILEFDAGKEYESNTIKVGAIVEKINDPANKMYSNIIQQSAQARDWRYHIGDDFVGLISSLKNLLLKFNQFDLNVNSKDLTESY